MKINKQDVYEKITLGQIITEEESNIIDTPVVPDSIFDKVIKQNGEEFKRWINVKRMTEWLTEIGENAKNPENSIENKPITHTHFYGQFVGLIQEITKNRSMLRSNYEISGGNIVINGVNYKISLEGKEQIDALLEALNTIKANAVEMNVAKEKVYSYFYNRDAYYYNNELVSTDAVAVDQHDLDKIVSDAGR